MNNALIEILIKDKQRTIKGKVIRATMFARSKVFQVQTTDNENLFLIYYRNSLIYGEKLEKVADSSFIAKVFRDGIVIESTHPILSAVIPKQTVSIPKPNKLFSQLQPRFSPQEIAYIATTLDSFFEKDALVKVIEQIYFDYKRNGKFMKAFQILQILNEFIPSLKSANERLSSREFYSYHDFYQSSNLSSIFEKDPLYVELSCFKNRLQSDAYQLLVEILNKTESFVEMILLWLEKTERIQKAESIEKYTLLALKVVTMPEWVRILAQVKINPFRELTEAKTMVEKMIQTGNDIEAALLLLDFIDDLPAAYDSILKKLWANLDADFIVSHLDHFIAALQKQGHDGNQTQSESQIFQLVVNMLKGYDLQAVYDKLLPLKKVMPHSMVLRKLNKMAALLEDPERMMELGDNYAEFQQYDSAIDCYFWEMELKPQDPAPVWKLCKMYQQKGMVKEAAAYQKVFAELKRVQEMS